VKRERALVDAIRRNRAKRILPKWLSTLRNLVAADLREEDFLSVELTARLKGAFYQRVKDDRTLFHKEWSVDEFDRMKDFIGKIGGRVGSMKAVLFSSKDTLTGAVVVPAARVLLNVQRIREMLEEDVSLTTRDLENGFCLEFNYYDEHGRYVEHGTYLLTTWGSFSENRKSN
jgi:hypothetical protein